MAKRVEYFDIAKGIGMICIIMGHLGIGRVNSFVFTFHVPLFFLISGYFLNDHTGIREFVVKKTRQLIIPYIVTCICIIFGVTAWDIVKNNTFENVVYNVKTYTIASFFGSGTIEYTEPFYVKQIGAAWFLLALFFALLIVRTLMEYQFGGIAIFAIAYIGYKTTDILWLPFSIQAGMTASLFVYIGFLAKKYDVFAKKLSTAVLSITSAVWLWCIIYCGRLYMVRNYYENGLLDVLGALAGSYIVIILSKTLEKKTKWCAGILKFFGVNSLLLLCCHAFELNVVSWDWVWRLFSDRMHFQYYNVVIILICIKLIVFAVAIGIIKFLIRFFKNRQIGRIFIEGKNLLLDKKKTVETGRIKYWDMVKGLP